MPERYVLDSFAILALLSNEPGSEEVAGLLRQAGHDTQVLMS